MFFRFGSALVLVVLVSLIGVGLEKKVLVFKRTVSRQHYQMDALRDARAKVRLQTQRLGAPKNVLERLDQNELELHKVQSHRPRAQQAQPQLKKEPRQTTKRPTNARSTRMPLLNWQRATSETR